MKHDEQAATVADVKITELEAQVAGLSKAIKKLAEHSVATLDAVATEYQALADLLTAIADEADAQEQAQQ